MDNKPYVYVDPTSEESVKKIEAEIAQLRAQLTQKPTDADLHFRLGALSLRLERHADAIQAFEHCLRQNPEYPEVNFLLGNAYLSHKQYEIAARYFMKMLRSNPNHCASLYNIGLCYVETGLHQKAVQAFRKFHALETAVNWKEEARYQLYKLGYNP